MSGWTDSWGIFGAVERENVRWEGPLLEPDPAKTEFGREDCPAWTSLTRLPLGYGLATDEAPVIFEASSPTKTTITGMLSYLSKYLRAAPRDLLMHAQRGSLFRKNWTITLCRPNPIIEEERP